MVECCVIICLSLFSSEGFKGADRIFLQAVWWLYDKGSGVIFFECGILVESRFLVKRLNQHGPENGLKFEQNKKGCACSYKFTEALHIANKKRDF